MEKSKLQKPISVLKAMMYGEQEIDLGQGPMAIVETEDGWRVAHVCQVEMNGKLGGKKYLPSELTLEWFIKACEKMSDDQVFLIGGNSALRQISIEKGEQNYENY
jgi:hypothetical protein